MSDMKRTSDCCPACCVTPPAPCKADCSLQRTPMRKRAAPAPAAQPPSIGYVNLKEGTFHTLAQLAATERNGDLIASGEIVEVCPVVRGAAAPASPASAPVASNILPWEKRYMDDKYTTRKAAMLEEIDALRAACQQKDLEISKLSFVARTSQLEIDALAAPVAHDQAQSVPSPSIADLEAIDRAMQHMGDNLNGIDAAEEEGEVITRPGFDAIARLLAAAARDAAPVISSQVPQELIPHLRQYLHNDASGVVFGYDKSGTEQELAAWREAYENMRAFAESKGLDTRAYNTGGPVAAPLPPVVERKELTDADIQQIATAAYRNGELSWLGFDIDPATGTYGIPVLSTCHYQLVRAAERHIARPAASGAARLVPDSECVQSQCACTTTGCWGECSLKRNPVVIVKGGA